MRLNVFMMILIGISTVNVIEIDAAPPQKPIIGILVQELPKTLNNIQPGMYISYIAASYVKLMEGGGARVVPIK